MICKRVVPYNDIVGESAPFAHPCCPYVIVYDRQVGNCVEIGLFAAVLRVERVVRACSVHCEGDGNMLVRSGLARRLSSHVRIYQIHKPVVGLAHLILKAVCKAHHRPGSRAALFLAYIQASRTAAVSCVVALRNVDKFEIKTDNGAGGKLGGDIVFNAFLHIFKHILIGIAYLLIRRIVTAPMMILRSVGSIDDTRSVRSLNLVRGIFRVGSEVSHVIPEQIRIEQIEHGDRFLFGVGAHVDELCLGEIAVSVGERAPVELLLKEEPRAVHAASGDRAFDHKA